jgi:hypothetical protein
VFGLTEHNIRVGTTVLDGALVSHDGLGAAFESGGGIRGLRRSAGRDEAERTARSRYGR